MLGGLALGVTAWRRNGRMDSKGHQPEFPSQDIDA
jgi:hypothetical protein